MDTLKKNFANLLKVKTIVTLILTVVFGILAVRKDISSENFMTIFSVVIAFYFATQSEKNSKEGDQA
jgi:heme O synthase-like polyprenyltransferase